MEIKGITTKHNIGDTVFYANGYANEIKAVSSTINRITFERDISINSVGKEYNNYRVCYMLTSGYWFEEDDERFLVEKNEVALEKLIKKDALRKLNSKKEQLEVNIANHKHSIEYDTMMLKNIKKEIKDTKC